MSEFRQMLTRGFRLARARGYFARQNWKCCQSCGYAAMPDGTTNYVFYHRQDASNLRETEERIWREHGSTGPTTLGVYLAWSGDGRELRRCFLEAGLAVRWDGSSGQRIWVSLPPKEALVGGQDVKYTTRRDHLLAH